MSKMPQKLAIRNSTVEFLIFTQEAGENSIEVRYHNETIWLTQKMMAELFNSSVDNIILHLKNIYATGELQQKTTTEDSSVVQKEGDREVKRTLKLDAAIRQNLKNWGTK